MSRYSTTAKHHSNYTNTNLSKKFCWQFSRFSCFCFLFWLILHTVGSLLCTCGRNSWTAHFLYTNINPITCKQWFQSEVHVGRTAWKSTYSDPRLHSRVQNFQILKFEQQAHLSLNTDTGYRISRKNYSVILPSPLPASIIFLLQENNPSFHGLGLTNNFQEFTHVLDATVRSLTMP